MRTQVTQAEINRGHARSFMAWSNAKYKINKGQRAKQAPDGTLVFTKDQVTHFTQGFVSSHDNDISDEDRAWMPGNPLDYGDR